jgi:hypothetical protein
MSLLSIWGSVGVENVIDGLYGSVCSMLGEELLY